MKKYFFIIILLTVTINAQNWNPIITTSINVSNVTYIENHADKDGIHIVTLDNNNDIKYYLIDTYGSTIRSSTISTNGDYPNIVGDENAVFIIYREGSYIRVKRTTDAGASWSQRHAQSIGSNPCSGIDAAIDYRGIHVVWSIGDANGYNMETNYKRFDDQHNDWFDFYTVTNYAGGYGTSPTVSLSPDRVHVGYNSVDFTNEEYTYDGNEMSRTKYNNNWQTQQIIALNESGRGKIFTASSKLYDFYYDFVPGMGQFHSDLYFRNRSYGSSNWSSSTLLESFSDVTILLSVCETADGTIHTYTASGSVKERIIINGSVSSSSDISNTGYWINALSAISTNNDVFVSWSIGNSIYLKMRQYDGNPSKPQNLSAIFSGTHPVLTWSSNMEPDIQSYKIYKIIEGETGWTHVATVSSSTTQWIDNDVSQPGKFDPIYTIDYKIKAVDQSNNESVYSDVIKITGTTNTLWKQNINATEADGIKTYELFSNFPNPFNPTTQITYQIPKSEFVNLVVYNNLGQLVSTLVNEIKEKGRYTVEFNTASSGLPSGMYIYKITAGKYHASGKMLLMK